MANKEVHDGDDDDKKAAAAARTTSMPNNTPRECEECGKCFSSGKALGGHRRSHFQAAKKEALLLRIKIGGGGGGGDDHDNPAPPPTTVTAAGGNGPITCFLCNDGRVFSSRKGLFGHMRSHPERLWRGINPPNNTLFISSSCSTSPAPASTLSSHHHDHVNYVSGGHFVDLMETMKSSNWAVRARRGINRRLSIDAASASGSSLEVEEEEDMIREAANDLLFLANSSGSSNGSGSDFSETGCANKDSAEMEEMVVRDGIMGINGKGKEKAVVVESEDCAGEIDDDGERDGRMQKKRRLDDLEKVEEFVDNRASHNRYKNVVVVINDDVIMQQQSDHQLPSHDHNVSKVVSDTANLHANNKQTVNKVVKVERQQQGLIEVNGNGGGEHQCNLCGLSFPTGQALGGHKRRHRIHPAADAPPPPTLLQVTSSAAAGEVTQTARINNVHHFDLNFPPAPMEDNA